MYARVVELQHTSSFILTQEVGPFSVEILWFTVGMLTLLLCKKHHHCIRNKVSIARVFNPFSTAPSGIFPHLRGDEEDSAGK